MRGLVGNPSGTTRTGQNRRGPDQRAKRAAALMAAADKAASAGDPDPPPDTTKARATLRAKRAAKSK